MRNPLLSICIPTWNRGPLLKLLLKNIAIEAHELQDIIEVVISDNASSDNTYEVVKSSSISVVYERQAETVSFTKNLLHATAVLARGKYIWIIGDDDLILPGGIRRIIRSLQSADDIDYHYINFGWIDVALRNTLLREMTPPPSFTLKRLQCSDRNWKRLPRIEDLVFLPGQNPSALFSGIFCFIVKRKYFVENKFKISPTNSLDGSSVELSDAFPHAMLTLPYLAGRPVVYIGEPSVMQGINGWEWGRYAAKTMIRSTYDLLKWLESTNFSKDAIKHLQASFSEMTGRLFARMLIFPEKNAGIDMVIQNAVPAAAENKEFWTSLVKTSQYEIQRQNDKEKLKTLLSSALSMNPTQSICVWGHSHFINELFEKNSTEISLIKHIVDSNPELHGYESPHLNLKISNPDIIKSTQIDILLITVQAIHLPDIYKYLNSALPPKTIIISVNGIQPILSSKIPSTPYHPAIAP